MSAHGANPVDINLNFLRSGSPVAVQLRAWIPDGVDRFRGVLFNLPGSGQDTRGLVNDAGYRARLPGMEFAYIGMRDVFGGADVTYWGNTPDEAQSNLQSALNAVANAYSHPEIRNAPVVPMGISKGGFSAAYVSSMVPSRSICYVADKGLTIGNVDPDGMQVPGFAIGGSIDATVPPDYMNTVFSMQRTFGANLALAVDWGVGHANTDANLPFSFISQAMRVRYPAGQVPSAVPGQPLQLVTQFAGAYLADTSGVDAGNHYIPMPSPQILPVAQYTHDADLASWLPTKSMAMVYKARSEIAYMNPLLVTVLNATNGAVNTGEALDLGISLRGGFVSDHIELFHDDELIAVLSTGAGVQHVTYVPTEKGLHNFVAVAKLAPGMSVLSTTSNFTTVSVGVVPEPGAFAALGLLTCIALARGHSRASREIVRTVHVAQRS